MTEKYTFEEITDQNCGCVLPLNDRLLELHASALSKVPKEIAERVLEECLFLVPDPGMGGFRISKRVLQGKDVIVLSEKLLEKDNKDIVPIILHEVAHFYLNHKSRLLDQLSEEEDRKQEEAADRWARQWIEDTTV